MRPLQPVFDPSKYAERICASRTFQKYHETHYPCLPIVGPFSYFSYARNIEKLRRIVELGDGQVIENVLLWGRGEPILPYQTKFGGSPYRPAQLPWPRGRRGQLLPFIMQLNFSAIAEHKHDKELLLIFGEFIEDEVADLYCEWHSPLNGDVLALAPPPKTLTWPESTYYAEMTRIEVFPESIRSSVLKDEVRRITGIGNIRHLMFPNVSTLSGWNGLPADEEDDLRPIASIQSFKTYYATDLAWLNADETEEDVNERASKHFLSASGPGGVPGPWFELGDMGRFVIGINHAGEVEGWIESH